MSRLYSPYAMTLSLLIGLSFFPLATPSSFRMEVVRNKHFEEFPFQIGEWRGKEAPVEERTYEILETRNVLSRLYENTSGEEVYLLLVSSHRDRRVAHPPEVCYLSSNYFISHESEDNIAIQGKSLPVKVFEAKGEKDPNLHEFVLYVYKVGEQFTTNYYAQQLRFAMDRLTQKNSEVLLIRVSARKKEVALKFLREAFPEITSMPV